VPEPAASATLPQGSLPEKVTYSEWIASRLWVEYGVPFTFEGRPYLKKVHDLDERKVLFRTARQVEKSQSVNARNLMADGSWKRAGDIVVGDRVASFDEKTQRMVTGTVAWKSDIYRKNCRRITTAFGHVAEIADTHPVWTGKGWVPAGDLFANERLAVVRSYGEFGETEVSDDRIALTAFLIGDGSTIRNLQFCHVPGPVWDDFTQRLTSIGDTFRLVTRTKTPCRYAYIHSGKLMSWIREDGLYGKKSAQKFLPAWVFRLSREKASLFLNRLWSTDGHVKKNATNYSIEYCSMSEALVRQVQSLLWKFGVPSSIRKNWPNIYKKRGEEKFSRILRIITAEGVRRFLTEIGALGKSEGVPLPDSEENNNRDTLPIETNILIKACAPNMKGCTLPNWTRGQSTAVLYRARLRRTLRYPPTHDKLAEYLEELRPTSGSTDAFRLLETYASKDVIWDRVRKIDELEEQDCVDFSVEGTSSYIVEGLVTHNTSTEAAKLVSWSCLRPGWKSLYVSPSQKQTRVFSHARLDKVLASPFVRGRYFDPKRCVDDVYEKTYLNGSTTWLSYANTTADRCRGISSDLLLADEIQDMVIDVFPVLEETLSHSPNPYQLYAGTPKTTNNSMETHWKNSTQCEWLVHCFGCGDWVFQDERVVRKEGPTCPKCGKGLDPQFGRWEPYGAVDAEFAGFRIPQTIVPWIAGMPSKWAELFRKHEKWPQQQFYNEVLGLAHEKGANPLTESDIKKCCSDRGMYEHRPADLYFDALYAGVDWGAGIRSYTVVFVIGQNSDKLHVLYAKRFADERGEPGVQVDEIARICQRFGVAMAGCDWGGGFVQNHQLSLDLTGHADVIQFYESGTKKRDITYEQKSRLYTFNRNAGLYSVIDGIKNGQYVFPRWEEFQEFASDFICVFEDYNAAMRMMTLDHPVDLPDDALHALLFATCTFRVARGLKAFS